MRIAAFNVENLFDRPKAFNDDVTQSSEVLDAHADLNKLFEKTNYTAANKSKILVLMEKLGILNDDDGAGRHYWMGLTPGIGEMKYPFAYRKFILKK